MERKIKIIHNRLRCKKCGEIIESYNRHSFIGCKCFRDSNGNEGIAVDGGRDYLRRIGNPNDYEDMSETRPYTDEERDEYNRHQELLAEQYGWVAIDYME